MTADLVTVLPVRDERTPGRLETAASSLGWLPVATDADGAALGFRPGP